MLTDEEKKFIDYWEKNRDKQKKTFRQLLFGIPIGLIFALPILLNFASGWYKRAGMMINTTDFNPVVLLVAIFLIIGFIAIFSKRHKWEQNDQFYKELKARESADSPGHEKI
ncbi:MAG: hypothetical protein JST75_18005 [Bacteroidetes bacterium]|nr:hypothetical protein [Bacteroidota bacterium]